MGHNAEFLFDVGQSVRIRLDSYRKVAGDRGIIRDRSYPHDPVYEVEMTAGLSNGRIYKFLGEELENT